MNEFSPVEVGSGQSKNRAENSAEKIAEKPSRGQSLKAAREALNRSHILETAESVFAEHGYAATRMQDIAKVAGMSLNTLYQSYPGKAELHRAILVARDEQMFNAVLDSGHALPPASIEDLLRLMQVHLRFLLEHPDYLKMQLQEGRAWYHSAARPSDAEQALWERGLQMMAAVFEHGMGQGWFFPQDAQEQARMMLALQQARLSNWMAAGMVESHESVIKKALADFVRQFCSAEQAARLLKNDRSNLVAE